jgi:DNA-binding response OmpR family regulator
MAELFQVSAEVCPVPDELVVHARILLLEHDEQVGSILEHSLAENGFDVVTVPTSALALRELVSADFDLIFCDLTTQDSSGEMFYTEAIRAKPHLARRFVFLIGESSNAEACAFVRRAGGLILWKPFTLNNVYETIHFLLKAPAANHPAVSNQKTPPAATESQRLMQLAIASGRERLRFTTSSFTCDDPYLYPLIEARRRGVSVEVMLPAEKLRLHDKPLLSAVGRLLETGSQVFTRTTSIHPGRMVIVDDAWVCMTWTTTSESRVNMYRGQFAAQEASLFETSKANSTELTLEDWRALMKAITRTEEAARRTQLQQAMRRANARRTLKTRIALAGLLLFLTTVAVYLHPAKDALQMFLR